MKAKLQLLYTPGRSFLTHSQVLKSSIYPKSKYSKSKTSRKLPLSRIGLTIFLNNNSPEALQELLSLF